MYVAVMAGFAAAISWPEARGMWRGPGGHLGKASKQAIKQAGSEVARSTACGKISRDWGETEVGEAWQR